MMGIRDFYVHCGFTASGNQCLWDDGTSPEKLYSLESSPEQDVMHISAQHRAKGTTALPKEFWHGLTFPVEGKRERIYMDNWFP